MKILKAKGDNISFKYSGSSTIEITKEGVLVSDIVAQTALDRLAVTVEDAPETIPEILPEVPTVDAGPSLEATVEPIPTVDAEIIS